MFDINLWMSYRDDHIWQVHVICLYNLDDTPFTNMITSSSVYNWTGIAGSIKGTLARVGLVHEICFITQTERTNLDTLNLCLNSTVEVRDRNLSLNVVITQGCGSRYSNVQQRAAQIAKFMGPTWGPPGSCRPQMGPMLAPWTLLSGYVYTRHG